MSRKQFAKIVLLVAVVLSIISLVEATMNYVRCYEALTNFELQVKGVDFTADQKNLSVTITLSVSNPTSYGNLQLKGILGDIYYEGERHIVIISSGGPFVGTPYQEIETRWWGLPPREIAINRAVPPYSAMTFSMDFTAKDETANTFLAYFEKQGKRQEDIRWQLNLRVFLDTPIFLNTIGLEYQFLMCKS